MAEALAKAEERRWQWFGHVKRREDYVGKGVMEMDVQGRQKQGRPKLQRKDQPREDLRGTAGGGLSDGLEPVEATSVEMRPL